MHPLYDKFCKLCEELAIKNRIDPILSELYSKRTELESALNNLNNAMQKEQVDVDQLEKLSISSFFYTVIGQKEKKLEKEKAEAIDAQEKYSDLQNKLSELNEEIKKYERELRTVRGCDLRYGRLLPQILDEIKASDTHEATAVIDTFDSLTRIEEKIQKFDEELELCREAMTNVINALKHLEKAYSYAQKRSSYLHRKNRIRLTCKILVILEDEIRPIIEELYRQIKRLDAGLVGSRIDFEIKAELTADFSDISELKAATERLIPQIEEIQRKLREARDRWAKVVEQRRTELHEQIKAVLA